MEKRKLKKKLLFFCFIANLFMIAIYLSVIIAAFFKFQKYIDYIFFDVEFANIRMFLTIFVFILWINNLIVWSKRDKNLGRFFILFFFIGIYSPFYFIKILKNKWQ
ncbi:MAG: hypothetical protein Q8928_10300 [Bacteroidota bacterium]|nr:hypothetical protein [Bacteroidota bacterium]